MVMGVTVLNLLNAARNSKRIDLNSVLKQLYIFRGFREKKKSVR
jgi:hypothetical protein